MNLVENLEATIFIFTIIGAIISAMWKLFGKTKKIDTTDQDLQEFKKFAIEAIEELKNELKSVRNSEIKELKTDLDSIKGSVSDVEKNITQLISAQYEKILDRESRLTDMMSEQYDRLMDKIVNIKQDR